MFAIAATKTDHHPRGSGPPYGEQFPKLTAARHALDSYNRTGPVQLIIMADVHVATDLYAPVRDEHQRHVATDCVAELPFDALDGVYCTVLGPFAVVDGDETIRTWWEQWGRFDSSPWDPNGILTVRRLGLTRGEDSDCFSWEDNEGDVLAFDHHCWAAFDQGEYAVRPWPEIWNEASEAAGMGWRWIS